MRPWMNHQHRRLGAAANRYQPADKPKAKQRVLLRVSLTAWLMLSLTALLPQAALAQDTRSLGMGGTSLPSSAGGNPAFGAVPDASGGVSIPLPLGAINALTMPELAPQNESFDLLTLVDQLTHLDTLIFNPAASPDDVIVRVRQQDGVPAVAIDLAGGSPLRLESASAVRQATRFELPLAFDAGPVRVGVRPYLSARGRVTPGEGFADLFGGGTSSASASGAAHGEAGIGLNVAYATSIALPEESGVGDLYLGVRAEPFLGLAKADASGDFRISAVEGDSGEPEYRYDYEADWFYAVVGQGGIGYGIRTDLGVALDLPTDQGQVLLGLALEDLGVSFWNGVETSAAGSEEGEGSGSGPVSTNRTYAFDSFGVLLNVAYEPDLDELGVPGLGSLLVAADASYRQGLVGAHLGAEAGFGAGGAQILARAGAGFDNGLIFGIGTGVRFAGVGLDAAIHSYRSPFTSQQAVGASLGLGFGF